MLPIKKIYIDSRFRSNDSASHTDFKIDLPTSIYLPDNTGLFITDICIPMSWYTIDASRNNKLYFAVKVNATDEVLLQGTIAPGNYNIASLAEAISTALNNSGNTSIGTFTVTTHINQNKIDITNSTRMFRILTDA